MDINLELTPHPAQATYRGQPVFIDGKPVPMFANARAIRLNGLIVGYVEIEDGKPINLIDAKLPTAVVNRITEFVRATLNTNGQTVQAPERIEVEPDEDD